MIVHQDAELARALADRRWRRSTALAPGERDRLLETLRAWLDLQRHTPEVAQRLHVHPQTVRYRMGKLEELLGDRLTTPDGRFALAVALRAPPPLSGAQQRREAEPRGARPLETKPAMPLLGDRRRIDLADVLVHLGPGRRLEIAQ